MNSIKYWRANPYTIPRIKKKQREVILIKSQVLPIKAGIGTSFVVFYILKFKRTNCLKFLCYTLFFL
jgi:hypothetical protein